jgi:hypothetical protein
MADYRKSLMDMTPEERAEVAPGFVPSDDVSTPLSVKVADEAISLATPIDSIVEIQEELAKDEPDYLKIGMLGGMEAIGLLAPGAGKAAQSMIRKGADMARQTDNVVDVASNVPKVSRSVTPSYTDEALLEADEILFEWGKGNLTNPQLRKAMSDKGFKIETKTISPKMTADDIEVVGPDGNIVRWKDMPRGTGAIDTTKSSVEAAGLTDEAIDAWREANATSPEFRKALKGRNEELMDLAAGVKEGRVFNTTYWKRADELRPIRKVTEVPKPATVQDTVSALDKGKRKSPIVGLNYDIPDGEKITARLDIPAYVDYDVWIPTLRHSGKTMYKPALRMKNVKFIQPEGRESGMALDVAVGPQRLQDEFGLADKKAKAKGNKSPFAVMEGEYVKATDDEAYEYATSIFDSDEWTQAGYDPSKRGFFYDRETGEAILSGDEVVQVGHLVLVKNAEKVNPEVFGFSEGGMAMDEQMDAVFKSSRTGYAEGGEVGAAPDTTIGVDPVSGNEVPMGATPEEVRDDIPAQLSEGEYVVPADVVRFYGVKFFEDLRTQAKQGYAEMDQNGRIGGEPVGQDASGMEMVEPEDDLPFDISELQIVDDETGMYEGGLAGYAEGGLPEAPAQTPVPTNPFSPTGSMIGYEIKEYENEAGDIMYIQFMNGQPMTYIPEGFKPKGSAAEEVADDVAAPAPTPTDNDNDYDSAAEMGKVDTAFTQGASAKDWTRATAEDFAKARKQMGFGTGAAQIGGALFGGPIGAIAGIGAKDEARKKAYDMLDGISYQLESGNLSETQKSDLLKQQQEIQDYLKPSSMEGKFGSGVVKGSKIFGGATSLYENLGDYGGSVVDGEVVGDGKRTFADTWLGDLLGADGKAGVQGPSLSESLAGARRTAPDWEDEGDRDRAAERMKAREATPYEKAMSEKDYDKAADIATSSWQAATNAVNSASASDDPAAWSAAIKAQSEASKAATKAIQAKTGWTGFFSPPKD